jgi:pimeloyl-ACP methyl ester carboxylesterase
MKRFFKRSIKFLGIFILGVLIIFGGVHLTSRALIARLTAEAKDTPLFQDVQYVTVNDDQLAYRIYNPGQEKTVIMIHGFMGSSYEFDAFFESFVADNDFTVIAFDTMGFGFSDKPLDYLYTSQNHANTFLQAIDALEIDTFTLMGHSMGGGIAIRMALMDQSRVENLVLIAAVGPELMETSGNPLPLWFFNLLFKNYFAQRLGINTATVEPLPQDVFAPFIIQNATIPGEVLQKFTIDQDTESYFDDLKTLEVRTFLIYGTEDAWTPPSLLITYVQELPNSAGYQLAESGHLPYLEQPEELKSLIENFINKD